MLPHADLKIFLDASVEERARRRTEERDIEPDGPEARWILAQLRRRDEIDRNRAVAPLRPADDARHIHTDGNTFAQTVAAVVAAIREAARTAAPRADSPVNRVTDARRADRHARPAAGSTSPRSSGPARSSPGRRCAA